MGRLCGLRQAAAPAALGTRIVRVHGICSCAVAVVAQVQRFHLTTLPLDARHVVEVCPIPAPSIPVFCSDHEASIVHPMGGRLGFTCGRGGPSLCFQQDHIAVRAPTSRVAPLVRYACLTQFPQCSAQRHGPAWRAAVAAVSPGPRVQVRRPQHLCEVVVVQALSGRGIQHFDDASLQRGEVVHGFSPQPLVET